ncbi:7-carboxy-7-deazaguanine synthase QueE [Ferruginibacter albus]|uniref:7-carboxy-7-deazaguanine synthase QueE n=1 Tax=Ferruginibacter albus TaxID=2875540 RepID=UPI001CC44709|nr:7-carboxy-7-deazaguanine synthase QueE [Ferruginibacter albus]UAY51740.1 7-carboxy-7-deazaguanine synthase QueE [Ferruginibacter albus]
MEHFYTIQGEGYHQGKAAYFIRLGGCDVGCVWCDVKDSWDATKHPVLDIDELISNIEKDIKRQTSEVRHEVDLTSHVSPIAVITGGEPLLHDLTYLTSALKEKGFQTNIETSGSSPLSGTWDWICLSPKKFKAPLNEVVAAANELKVVIFNKSDFDWAEKYAALVSPTCKLYLQPEWDKAAVITPLIIDYVKAHPKWELSLQIHKYINVP